MIERVKRIYDRQRSTADPDWREGVKRWLMTHSEYFHDDLIQAAKNAVYKRVGLKEKRNFSRWFA